MSPQRATKSRQQATHQLFNLAQCNAMLPLVQAVSEEVVERRHRRSRLLAQRAELEQSPTPEGLTAALGDLDARITAQEDGIRCACKELGDYGLTVLRLNPLVVHFPGRTRDGELVFCWQEDDQTVAHGHPHGEEEEPRFPLKLRS